MMAPLLGNKRQAGLRTRRRWTTYAYLALALSAGYMLLGALRGSKDVAHDSRASPFVQMPWHEQGGGKLDGLFNTRLAGWSGNNKPNGVAGGRKGKKKGSKGKGRPKPAADNEAGQYDEHETEAAAFKEHKLLPNGLMEVIPGGRHPIFDLITRAEQEWADKNARASKSLDEAVAEYRRRYGRNPPKGFDLWWDYVEEHDVQLPDEYDMIHRDFESFWSMSPQDMRASQVSLEGHPDSWTMGKTNSYGVMLVNMSLLEHSMHQHLDAAYQILDTLRPVQDQLPNFRAVFNPHDNPQIVSSHEYKSLARTAAKAEKYLDTKNLQTESVGWLSACAKTSPARKTPFNLDNYPPPPTKKTFIYDHMHAMDPCLHPTLLHHHGQFIAHEHGPGPTVPQSPLFGWTTSMLHSDLRVAAPFNWVDDIPGDTPWELKRDDRLLWRGSNTGIWHGKDQPRWRHSHRERMISFSDQTKGTAHVLIGGERDEVFHTRKETLKRLNGAMFDMEFAGEPLGCEDETCEEMKKMFEYVEQMDWRAAGEYKFVMDIDGNGWSSRFKRLITSHALIFKASIYPEWFQERIQPWVHYVPIQMDFSDLYDALAFFRGDASGVGAHDELAAKIAAEGRRWSQGMWRKEDMTAYNFRVILEYARLMSFDREAMTYKEEEE